MTLVLYMYSITHWYCKFKSIGTYITIIGGRLVCLHKSCSVKHVKITCHPDFLGIVTCAVMCDVGAESRGESTTRGLVLQACGPGEDDIRRESGENREWESRANQGRALVMRACGLTSQGGETRQRRITQG
jgi:hypothetical protein